MTLSSNPLGHTETISRDQGDKILYRLSWYVNRSDNCLETKTYFSETTFGKKESCWLQKSLTPMQPYSL